MSHRYLLAFLSAFSFSWSMFAGLARAQECSTDADCHPGQECRADGADNYCERATCETDADCPTNFECELGPVAGIPCAGSNCPAPPEPTGECKPQQLPCETDADCPEGLSCVDDEDKDDCAVDIGGGDAVACETQSDSPARACAFVPVLCERDVDCEQPGFVCSLIDERRECQNDSTPTCAPGSECPAPEPEPQIEDCELRELRFCFPERVDCQDDGDCDGDWSCLQLSADDADHLPPAFEGATALCVPEGIELLATDQIDTPDVDVEGLEGGGSSASDDGSSSANESGNPRTASQNAQQGPSEKGDDGGLCSVRPYGHGDQGAGWLLALGAVSLVGLRRRRGRRRLQR